MSENKKEYTLEEMRKFCSNYIIQHYGKAMDSTPWWDKWRIIGTFKALKEEVKNEQICNFGQNE